MTDPLSHVQILQESLRDLIAESQSLRLDVHTAEVARRRNALVNLGVMMLLVIFVVLVFTVSWQNNRIGKQVRDGNDRIVDCTTAGGKCYQEGNARTGQAITAILRADIYVIECSRLHPNESGPAFDAVIEKCVTDRLAAAAAGPSPAPAPSPSR